MQNRMSWSFCCVRAPFVCKITVIWRIYGWLSKKKAFKNWKNTGLVVLRPPRNSSVWFSWTAMLVFIFNLTFSLRLYWEKNYLLDLLLYDTDYYGSSPMTGTSTCFGKAWWKVHFMRLAWEQGYLPCHLASQAHLFLLFLQHLQSPEEKHQH